MMTEYLTIEPYPPQPEHGMLTGAMSRGVKITHVPTGLTVIKTSFRAPHANKAAALNAMEMLLDQPEETEMTDKIEPCPFCGGKGVMEDRKPRQAQYVTCTECEAYGPVSVTEDDAVDRWNNRHQVRHQECHPYR